MKGTRSFWQSILVVACHVPQKAQDYTFSKYLE